MAFCFLAYLFSFWRYLRLCNISDDIIGSSTKTAQHSIENYSRNIKAVFFKQGTSNVHHNRNRMAPTMLLPWQHFWLQSPSVKNQIFPSAAF